MDTLKVVKLKARIGTFELGPVDLNVGRKEIVGLIGPSGCGKTLLLRTVAGLQEPVAGQVFIDGEDITYLEPHLRGLAFVFQDNALFPHFDTHNNIAFPLKIKKDPQTEEKVQKKAAELDGLADYLDRWPKELPAGMKKLTAIGRETVKKFNLILMDEPFERLDKKIRTELRAMIKRMLMAIDESVLIVLNDPEDALAITDRVYVMKDGVFVQSGEPREVYANPASHFVMELFSTMGINRAGGKVFRPQDVEIDENGSYAALEHCGPYDSKRVLCNAKMGGEDVVLLLPVEYREKPGVKIRIKNSFERAEP
jgi:multiple sugar transport system ATP-binding protein